MITEGLLPGELRVISRLPLLQPQLIIDVGSSYGHYSTLVEAACPFATVEGFDPQNGDSAIGATNGELELVIYPTCPQRSSGVKAYTDKVEGFSVKRTVPLRRLDNLFYGRQIDFLKADVEGMEWDVMMGLGTLRPRLVQFEYGWAGEFAGVLSDDFRRLFASWGYVMRELDFVGTEDAKSCYYNYLAGPNSVVEKFF
jgi:hypothetical protein